MTPNANARLLTLDAMRGVAACMVVALHTSGPGSHLMPSGVLAVDFFFMLSGLVISRAYDQRLSQGLTFVDFVRIRLVRLYPLFALGMVLDACRKIVGLAAGRPVGYSMADVGMAAGREALLLPSSPDFNLLFLINPPAWSLFYEILVNIGFALILFRLRTAMLGCVTFVAFGALIASAITNGSFDLGPVWSTAGGGGLRALFGFTLGMLLGRLRLPAPKSTWLVVPTLAALAAIFFAPDVVLAQGFCILVAMPIFIVLGSQWEPPSQLRRAFELLGESSYPMYALHWAFLVPVFVLHRLPLPVPIAIGICVFIMFGISLVVSRVYDIPARRALQRLLSARPSSLRSRAP